ncbi:hypothetical protein AAKU55_002041 [Oxalobacteraceae bacterium GrIS 1.11]
MHTRQSGLSRVVAGTLVALLLAACAETTPQMDSHFGDAARIAWARQVLHPEAVGNPDPVAGMDGRSARSALERYQKSFAEPAPQTNSFMIGVSGGK